MSHVITMDNVRQLNVLSFSKKDSSPRGVKTILKNKPRTLVTLVMS